MIRLRLTCPTCHGLSRDTTCSRGHEIKFAISRSLENDGIWDQCPRCASFDAYIQKDVPKNLLLVLLVPVLGLALYLLSINWFMGMGLLAALAIVDWVLYRTLPNVLVCYGCGTQVRGFAPAAHLKPHDHHTSENYRQARLSSPIS